MAYQDLQWCSGSTDNKLDVFDVFAKHHELFTRANENLEKTFHDIVHSLQLLKEQIQDKLHAIEKKQRDILLACRPKSSACIDFAQNCNKIERSLETLSAHASNLTHIKLTIARCGSLVVDEGQLASLVVEPKRTSSHQMTAFAHMPRMEQETSLERYSNQSWHQPQSLRIEDLFPYSAQTASFFVDDMKQAQAPRQSPKRTIFVFYLPSSILKSEQLCELFAPCGVIVNAFVALDKQTKKSRGYGFVDFQDEASAQKAVDTMDKYPIDGKFLSVSFKI